MQSIEETNRSRGEQEGGSGVGGRDVRDGRSGVGSAVRTRLVVMEVRRRFERGERVRWVNRGSRVGGQGVDGFQGKQRIDGAEKEMGECANNGAQGKKWAKPSEKKMQAEEESESRRRIDGERVEGSWSISSSFV
nr:hypothetical protein Iba_chr15aCG8320 [Ipomoea batatas]